MKELKREKQRRIDRNGSDWTSLLLALLVVAAVLGLAFLLGCSSVKRVPEHVPPMYQDGV